MSAVRRHSGAFLMSGLAHLSQHGVTYNFDQWFLPTKCYALNLALSGGHGYPMRQIIEVAGPEGSGKTTLIFEALSMAVNHFNCIGLFFDQETPVDDRRLSKFNLYPVSASNPNGNFLKCREASIERVFKKIEDIIQACDKAKDPRPIVVMLDSVGITPPESHLNLKDLIDTPKTAGLASAWYNMLRVWNARHYQRDITLFLVNHVTDVINTTGRSFGPKTTTPGGRAIRYMGTIRLRVSPVGRLINKEGIQIGHDIIVKSSKNKFAPPQQEVRLPLYYGNPDLPPEQDYVGTSDVLACLYFLKDRGAIVTSGSWSKLTLVDPSTGELIEETKFQGETGWTQVYQKHQNRIWLMMQALQYSPTAYTPVSAQASFMDRSV